MSPTSFKQTNLGSISSEPKLLTKVGIKTLNSLFIKRLLYQDHQARDISNKTSHKHSATQSPSPAADSVLEMRSEQKFVPLTDKQSNFLKMIKLNFLKNEHTQHGGPQPFKPTVQNLALKFKSRQIKKSLQALASYRYPPLLNSPLLKQTTNEKAIPPCVHSRRQSMFSKDTTSQKNEFLNLLLSQSPVISNQNNQIEDDKSLSFSPRNQADLLVHKQELKFDTPRLKKNKQSRQRHESFLHKTMLRRSSTFQKRSKYSSKSPTNLHCTESVISDSAQGYLDKKYSEKSILSIREAKQDEEGRYSEQPTFSQKFNNESNLTFGELTRQIEEEGRARKKPKVVTIYKKKVRGKIKLRATQRC